MRSSVSGAGIVALLLASLVSVPAEAGILSWLSKLSGPGPFLGVNASFALKCFRWEERQTDQGQPAESPRFAGADARIVTCSHIPVQERHATLFATVGAAWSLDNDLDYGGRPAPTVGMFKSGMSLDVTVFPWLDLGAGGGFRYFGGSGFDNFALPYVQPVRVGVRPLSFAKVDWLIVTFNGEFLLGVVDGPRFGATADSYRESNEFLQEWGLSIDLPRLLNKLTPGRGAAGAGKPPKKFPTPRL
jgi:hypothetical protein